MNDQVLVNELSGDTITITDPVSDQVVITETTESLQVITVGTQGVAGVAGTSGDLHYSQDFLVTSFITVQHNLGKFPSVTVINSAGDEVEGDVSYIDQNSLTVGFSGAFSGTVKCN
jgi:hypothetical protein